MKRGWERDVSAVPGFPQALFMKRKLFNVFVAVEPVETVVQNRGVGLGFFETNVSMPKRKLENCSILIAKLHTLCGCFCHQETL